MDIKILKDMFLTIEQGNLLKRQDQIIYKRIMVDLGLLKSGKVELRSTIDRGNLRKCLGIHCKKLTLIVKDIFSGVEPDKVRSKKEVIDGQGDGVPKACR